MNAAPQIAGLVWYRAQDYDRAKALMADAHLLPATYASWIEQAQRHEQRFADKGIVTVKAYIDPNTFAHWCAARGLHIDAKARMAFANAVAIAHVRNDH